MQKIFDMECVAKHIPIQSPAMNVPMTSSNGLILDLWMLSFAESAKYGLMGRWPANHQVRAHFPSFLNRGYEAHRESLEIKFDMTTVEADRSVYTIKPFTVGYVDGQTKAIIMLGILALLIDLDPWNLFQFFKFHILTPSKSKNIKESLTDIEKDLPILQLRASQRMLCLKMKVWQKQLPLSATSSATSQSMPRLRTSCMKHFARPLVFFIH